MMADAWHTLSDTLTSLIVIFGFWIAGRPSDERHPYGYGRAELIAAVVIATLLAVVGFKFMGDSVVRLREYRAVSFGLFPIVVFLASLVLKEALAQFSFWAGKKIKSNSLMADGWHHRSDAIASGMIVVGALLGGVFWWIDGAMGIGVSLLILYAAYTIVREASNVLIGEDIDRELEEKIRALVRKNAPQAQRVHHFHSHHYGGHREVTFHLKLPADLKLEAAHALASQVEKAIKQELDVEATIHTEPA
jgi:cation diffusion facilitator family transporter